MNDTKRGFAFGFGFFAALAVGAGLIAVIAFFVIGSINNRAEQQQEIFLTVEAGITAGEQADSQEQAAVAACLEEINREVRVENIVLQSQQQIIDADRVSKLSEGFYSVRSYYESGDSRTWFDCSIRFRDGPNSPPDVTFTFG